MPKTHHSVRVGYCVLCLVATCVGLACSGSKDPDAEVLDNVADRTPGIHLRPAKLKLRGGVPGQTLRHGDVILVLPRGWSVESKSETEDRALELRLRIPVDEKSAEGKLRLSEACARMIDPHDEWVLKEASQFVSNPQQFLSQYKSELEFLRAVCNVTPDDRRKAQGRARQWARYLLHQKRLFFVLTRYVETPALNAVLTRRKKGDYVVAFLFDKAGQQRGGLTFDILGDTSSEKEVVLLQEILANSRFASAGEGGGMIRDPRSG